MGLQFARLVALLLRDCSSPFAQGLPAASPDKSKRGRDAELTPITGEQDGARPREEEISPAPLTSFPRDLVAAIEEAVLLTATQSVLADEVIRLSNAQAGPSAPAALADERPSAPQPLDTLSPSGLSDAESDDESGMGKRARGRRVVSSDEEGGETGGSEVRRARRIDGSDEEDEPQSAGAL